MNRYKCIVIEDEPLAQNILKKYIADHPSLELVAICGDALEAQTVLSQQTIELIFLDINLPKLSGVSFIKALLHPPLIIFTTAYPEFAVEGFELSAMFMAMFGWKNTVKNSGRPCHNHPQGCEKSFCVHFFCIDEKRKTSANQNCC